MMGYRLLLNRVRAPDIGYWPRIAHRAAFDFLLAIGYCSRLGRRAALGSLLAIGYWLLLLLPSAPADSMFDADLSALTQAPHRLAGTPENDAAAAYVTQQLRAAGVTQICVQPFAMACPVTRRCQLIQSDPEKVFDLIPLRPNGLMLPTTGARDLSGPLRYAGLGSESDFSQTNLSIQGAIVILDYNCGYGWIRAFRLGARAVILVRGTNVLTAASSLHTECEANLPRFFYPGSPHDLPLGKDVSLTSDIQWRPATGHNVIGLIPGTNPVFSLEQEEVVVLAAPMDSFGEIPGLSPGARPAANAAALLGMTRSLVQHPPARHTLVAFFDADFQGHSGASAFYRALESDAHNRDVWVETRTISNTNETQGLESFITILNTSNAVDNTETLNRTLLARLKEAADNHVAELNHELRALRLTAPDAKDNAIIQLETDKMQWNELRRVIGGTRDFSHLTPEVTERFRAARGMVLASLTARLGELQTEAGALAADQRLHEWLEKCRIVLHIDLNLGDAGSLWAAMPGNGSGLQSSKDTPSAYGHVLRAFRVAASNAGASCFMQASADGSLPATSGLLGESRQLHRAGNVAGLAGCYNIAIVTCFDPLLRDGTPDDTLAFLHEGAITTQAADVAHMLMYLLDDPELSVPSGISVPRRYVSPLFENGMVKGAIAMCAPNGGAMPDTPARSAVMQFRASRWGSLAYFPFKSPGYDDAQTQITSQEGAFLLGPLASEIDDSRSYRARALQFDSHGEVSAALDQASAQGYDKRLNLFNATAGCVPLPPQRTPWLGPEKPPVNLMSALANATLDGTHSDYELADGILAWSAQRTEPTLKIFSLPQVAILNNGEANATPQKTAPEGQGIPADTGPGDVAVTRQSAADLLRLNATRLALLTSRNITDHSLEKLHQEAEAYLMDSDSESRPLRQEAFATASFWLSQEVYKALRQTLDDLVVAVMILLGLAIPFAFTLERVLIGATTIHRQILGFTAMFTLTFLALYVSHPAFAIANTPVIIFLGFTILIMSASVVVIIMQRFESELKQLQGLTNTVHAADVSRIGTFLAAMQMGISTMRRRPMRTALTAITVLLLTFTILCFASFRREIGPVRIFSSANPPDYSGALVHDVAWGALTFDSLDVLNELGGSTNDVTRCHRAWMTTYSASESGYLLHNPVSNQLASARAVLGIEDTELARRPDLCALFGNSLSNRILMTSAVARRLNVEPGQSIDLRGRHFTVGPILQARAVALLEDIGRNHVLPVDFAQPRNEWPSGELSAEASLMDKADWVPLSPDSVVITGAGNVLELGGMVHALTFYTRTHEEAGHLADRLAAILDKAVFGTRDDGTYIHVLGTVLAASGVKDLFFPILLGGLVIFGTMLGSVSDREREIYTFSALGLAPRHVATLFLSESLVYALLGGMGGYLLAQATLATLVKAAGIFHMRIPEMNVSSTNTIVTILIIMATVLVSALYPALRASRSANPGLMRTWRPPKPEGDTLTMVFPFTVSQYDATGILAFLREHFGNHGDVGLGRFLASGTTLTRLEQTSPSVRRLQADDPHCIRVTEARVPCPALRLTATLSLAPFDLGVSQAFTLETHPSDIDGIDEIHVRLRRLSGQPKDWQRLNKPFLDDLRRQFLIWRSLPSDTIETYRHMTLQSTGQS